MKRLVNWLKPYKIVIFWEWDTYQHRAMTLQESLQWAACYPKAIVQITRFSKFVCERRA